MVILTNKQYKSFKKGDFDFDKNKDAEIIKVFITDIITEDEKSRFKSN